MSATAAPDQGPHPSEKLLQIGMGFIASSMLHAVTKLGIPELLQDGPRPVADLAKAAGSNEDALYRGLRALASFGVFAESAPRVFSLTPPAEYLLADKLGSLRDMIIWMGNRFHLQTHCEMLHALTTGETVVEKVFGVSCFDYFSKNEEVAREFHAAMTSFSKVAAPFALAAYDFSSIGKGTLVDVGGGHGLLLSEILKKYPDIRGVLFDMEPVIPAAVERFQSLGLGSRCRAVAGDFFREVPAGDAYVMKHIIHDWDDDKGATILRNIHRASSPNARVVLLESVLAPGDAFQMAKWLDIEMLLLPGGRERTEEEFRALFAGAGFRLTQIVPTRSPLSILEAVKV